MIEGFPLLRQRPGSKGCLSTAVRAVLLWHGVQATQDEVSEWCGETKDGCWIDEAIEGLRLEGFDVEGLIQDAENRLRASVLDDAAPQPVILTLKDSAVLSPMDHAVVLVGIEQRQGESGTYEVVEFMDPLTGQIEQDATGSFWAGWDFAGGRAFIFRP